MNAWSGKLSQPLVDVLSTLYWRTGDVIADTRGDYAVNGVSSYLRDHSTGRERQVKASCDALAVAGLITCEGMLYGWDRQGWAAWRITSAGVATMDKLLIEAGKYTRSQLSMNARTGGHDA